MKYWAMRLMTAASLPVLLGACASCSGGATSSGSEAATAPSGSVSVKPCSASALALGYGTPGVAMTAERAVMYKIRNRGHAACSLTGYPGVTLYDAQGRVLAFRYTHGQSPYVTKAQPEKVVLPSGGSAFVLVAKVSCALDSKAVAAIRLTLPGQPKVVLTGPVAPQRSAGAAGLHYCKGGPADPGQAVGVSPVEATASAAGPFAR